MQWFYENGKPFILGEEERARIIPGSRLEQPRQQRGSRSTSASTGVDKGLEHRLLPVDNYQHQRVHPLSLTLRSLQF
ncbi:hypothetical protein V6N13_098666 [Hibiscus sabdariffa]